MIRSLFFLILISALPLAAQRQQTRIIPERFLRGYDPITVFFNKDTGPNMGGPLDQPKGVMELQPAHPGEYRWRDARTLQFMPTTPWPALKTYTVQAGGKQAQLYTFMSRPVSSTPYNGSRDLEPLTEIKLGFSQPITPRDLAAMMTLEVKPLPGTANQEGTRLDANDFTIKTMERGELSAPARYVLQLNKPIGYGKAVALQLRLSLKDSDPGALSTLNFATQPLFRLKNAGTNQLQYPVSAKGSVYAREQAIPGGSGSTYIALNFTADLGPLSMEQVKRLVHFEPAVKDLTYKATGSRLSLNFKADRDRAYRLRLTHTPMTDRAGRALTAFGDTEMWFYFDHAQSYLRWMQRQGILERHGAQQMQLAARGDRRVDLRIHKIDAQDRRFWPFHYQFHTLNENSRPPGPGEEPDNDRPLPQHIQLLGAPPVSRIVDLHTPVSGEAAYVGLDLAPMLSEISGEGAPGTYLVGFRRLEGSDQREYVRVQVTDLSLTTIEEVDGVTFTVTSLKTGLPVSGAKVLVEGLDRNNVVTPLIDGVTNTSGLYRYAHSKASGMAVWRIRVQKGDDHLVLNPQQPVPHLADNHFYSSYSTWLGWLAQNPNNYRKTVTAMAHMVVERPVYKPEEPVHIKGWLMYRRSGELLSPERGKKRALIVHGPGNKTWTYPITLTDMDSFYHKFDEKDLPTGDYYIQLDEPGYGRVGYTYFKKEAYRIPRFEARLTGPDTVPLDQSFSLTLTADYYAGGRVVGQPVAWKITAMPYRFQPKTWKGYLFSTDERFSEGNGRRQSRGESRSDVTDEDGSSTISIDPTAESEALPRRYVVEATIRGADEQTVSTAKAVKALPPFILGVKLVRYLEDSKTIQPKVIVLDHNGEPLADKPVTVRLLNRQWHSYLRESDFTTGEARYVTDVVDVPLGQQEITSGTEPVDLTFQANDSGVYLVELIARDRMGRMQKVVADLFVKGDTAVAWKKPKNMIFETVWDQQSYDPGDTATLLLKSPFQQAQALICVETPNANRYSWVSVEGGQGAFKLVVEKAMTSRIPVHVMLMRGRPDGKYVTDGPDLNRPKTMGATAWLQVRPKDYRAMIEVDHQKQCLPGAKVPLTLTLKDPDGQPLNGEVALWLVDRAVLALGREGDLDPVPNFVADHRAWNRLRDTRNQVQGAFPYESFPGGDGSVDDADLFGKVTVRRNFKTVPYYNPNIMVRDGKATITIDMPDNLTDFAVRAVGVGKENRWGYIKSMISVRLPVIAQSALPRFVRPGDRFDAGAIGRIVEGDGGPGKVAIQVDGLDLEGETTRSLQWEVNKPQQLYFPMTVNRQAAAPGDEDQKVTVRIAVSRDSDGAMDGFQIELPVKRDRHPVTVGSFQQMTAGTPVIFEGPGETPREGTLVRKLLASNEPGILKMLSALDYLSGFPHGCTEQRISRVMPELVMKETLDRIGRGARGAAADVAVRETLTHLGRTQDNQGLFSFWPGSRSYVSLTAYALEFMVAVKQAGYTLDDTMYNQAVKALQAALRSDYSGFIDGYAYRERTEALAALAEANAFNETYAFELAARAGTGSLYSESRILSAMLQRNITSGSAVDELADDLRNSLVYALRDGQEVYRGLQYRARSWGGLILSSEVRTLAAVTRALHLQDPSSPRLRPLVDELVSRGQGDGWGSTSANAAAMRTLNHVLNTEGGAGPRLTVTGGNSNNILDLAGQPMAMLSSQATGTLQVSVAGNPGDSLPLLWQQMTYLPAAPGYEVTAQNKGFVIDETLQMVQDDGGPPRKVEPEAGGLIEAPMGQIIEVHVRVINPEDRFFAAIRVPFAAGLEPLNPNLATAPPEAAPFGMMTQDADYALFEDDQVTWYYDQLPKGTYDFYFRLRASIAGTFTHPAPRAELMYRQSVFGRGNGARVRVLPRP